MPRLDVTTNATAKMVNDPIVFSIGGARLSGGEWREEFVAIPVLTEPAMTALGELAARSHDAASFEGLDQLAQIDLVRSELEHHVEFFDAVLGEDDARRLRAAIKDKDRLVDLEDVSKVIEFVVGAISGRPTGGQPNSPVGLSSTANMSPAASSSPATPPLPSLPSTGRTSRPSRSPSTSTASPAPSTSTGSSPSPSSVSVTPPPPSKQRTRATPKARPKAPPNR